MKNDNGGIINVYKPVGMTSFGVVSRIRRLVGVKKVGHCGTLDPFAEGVLPICIGRATAAVQYMDQYDKHYRVEMVFGMETDTQDRTGNAISTNMPTREDISQLINDNHAPLYKAVNDLIGTNEQLPPMYSAIKVNGKPLYEYARQGLDIERKKRSITIYDAKIINVLANEDLRATVDIHCSKGTYIRTICTDIGRSLSYGAYANSLLRTACGPFTVDNCITLEQIEELLKRRTQNPVEELHKDETQNPMEILHQKGWLIPTEFAMSHMQKVHLDKMQSLRIIQGQKVNYMQKVPLNQPLVTFYGQDRFIGITKGSDYMDQETVLSADRIFVDILDFQ